MPLSSEVHRQEDASAPFNRHSAQSQHKSTLAICHTGHAHKTCTRTRTGTRTHMHSRTRAHTGTTWQVTDRKNTMYGMPLHALIPSQSLPAQALRAPARAHSESSRCAYVCILAAQEKALRVLAQAAARRPWPRRHDRAALLCFMLRSNHSHRTSSPSLGFRILR